MTMNWPCIAESYHKDAVSSPEELYKPLNMGQKENPRRKTKKKNAEATWEM